MYKINEEKMFYDMADNQAIVINHVTGMYYGFNMLGSYVVDQLINGVEVVKIIEAIKKCAECPADIDKKVEKFISDVMSFEILIEDKNNSGTKDAAEVSKAALADGFELSVDSFAEAADLILADPVHDVDEGSGWPTMKE